MWSLKYSKKKLKIIKIFVFNCKKLHSCFFMSILDLLFFIFWVLRILFAFAISKFFFFDISYYLQNFQSIIQREGRGGHGKIEFSENIHVFSQFFIYVHLSRVPPFLLLNPLEIFIHTLIISCFSCMQIISRHIHDSDNNLFSYRTDIARY